MDESDTEQQGEELIATLVELTGLPPELLQQEVVKILETTGHDGSELTLDQLRVAMLSYLESLGSEMLAEEPSPAPLDIH